MSTAFTLRRGTNISHWLSQSKRRGAERRGFFTGEDIEWLAGCGFDHLRIPVDEEQLWDEGGCEESEAWDLLDAALDGCAVHGLRAIVDLHILRSHYFNSRDGEPRLFTDPLAAAQFADRWRALAGRLGGRPRDRVAYELLNEPVATDPADWNRVARLALAAIRESDPGRTVLLGSNRWNQVQTFPDLEIPADPALVLTCHYYNPMPLTHYRAPWWTGGFYDGPVVYPGIPIPAENLAALDPGQRAILEPELRPHGPDTMRADLGIALSVARRHDLPLHCGEFGCFDAAPRELRQQWYRDLLAVFDELGIAWSSWDYRGRFGVRDADRAPTGIAGILCPATA
jgi:endoglucanase